MSTLHGIFSYLKQLNGEYRTRYRVEGDLDNSGRYTLDYIDKYYDNPKKYSFRSSGAPEVNITFDSYFFLTAYSLSNSVTTGFNSAPKGWDVFGVDENDNKHLLDSQTSQTFCEMNSNGQCSTTSIKGYQIHKRKTLKGFKKFIFHRTQTSNGGGYLFFLALDFFGTLCGKDQRCYAPILTCESKSQIKITYFVVYFFSLSA